MRQCNRLAAAILGITLLAGCGGDAKDETADATASSQRVRPADAPKSTQQEMQESRQAGNQKASPSVSDAEAPANEQHVKPSSASADAPSTEPSNLDEQEQPAKPSDPTETEGAEVQETGDSEAK